MQIPTSFSNLFIFYIKLELPFSLFARQSYIYLLVRVIGYLPFYSTQMKPKNPIEKYKIDIDSRYVSPLLKIVVYV